MTTKEIEGMWLGSPFLEHYREIGERAWREIEAVGNERDGVVRAVRRDIGVQKKAHKALGGQVLNAADKCRSGTSGSYAGERFPCALPQGNC